MSINMINDQLHQSLTFKALKYFCMNLGAKGFFNFKSS